MSEKSSKWYDPDTSPIERNEDDFVKTLHKLNFSCGETLHLYNL